MNKLITALALLLVLCSGCQGDSHDEDKSEESKLIDLSHPFNNRSNYWPSFTTGFQMNFLSKGNSSGGFWLQAEEISSPVHGGTHMDAPRHFAAEGWAIDKIPVKFFIGPGSVIDVKTKVNGNIDYQLTKDDIQQWEKNHGSVSGSIVLINFGWGKHYNNRSYYFTGPHGSLGPHGNDTSNLHFPGIHPEAAIYLAEKSPRVFGVGFDTPSVDYGMSKDFKSHRELFAKQIYAVENVHNLDKLPTKVHEIVVLPMKIEGSGGAPVRMLARIRASTTDAAPYYQVSLVSLSLSLILLQCL